MNTYEHIIIGTGQATGTLLGQLIPSGESIAVIEGNRVGGSCVNYGCTPTKALVASAKAIHKAKQGEEFGFSTGAISIDFDRIMDRMNTIRNASSNGLQGWMESSKNVDLIFGWAHFTSDKVIEVNDMKLEGKHIYINTGTRPSIPPIEGIENINALDSAGLLELQELPQHLIILGGGYIGVEFAQVFRRFGSEVTIIQSGDQLMPREDHDVASSIAEFLTEEGISLQLNSRAKYVGEREGRIEVTTDQGKIVSGTHLLVAIGRKPNSDQLGLENTSITRSERGFIEVDQVCRTNASNVFALGDVNGHGAFTHTSVNDAEIVLSHLAGGNRKLTDRIPIYGLFTDPPLGKVGMSEKEALDAGIKLLKATRPMKQISRAKEMSETKGFAKLLVDAETDLIVGATILGPGGDEIVNMFAAIMHSQIPCKKYREVVLVHPTVSELMPWILDNLTPVNER
ncbi:MAG: mercuric reductase [Ekhidna sp.]|nr:mercuric reductase [Ekhidna sp.]